MDEAIWNEFVRRARNDDDQDALRVLFAQAEAAWGHEVASERWYQLMGEADGGAQTG